jgi:hypothetical protein
VKEVHGSVILSEAKDLMLRKLRSFAVFAAQDDVRVFRAAVISSERARPDVARFACAASRTWRSSSLAPTR